MAKRPDIDQMEWGVEWDEDTPHALDFRCKCGWFFYNRPDHLKYVVGIRWVKGRQIVIIECPHCFEKFWIHWAPPTEVLQKFCPNWPK